MVTIEPCGICGELERIAAVSETLVAQVRIVLVGAQQPSRHPIEKNLDRETSMEAVRIDDEAEKHRVARARKSTMKSSGITRHALERYTLGHHVGAPRPSSSSLSH